MIKISTLAVYSEYSIFNLHQSIYQVFCFIYKVIAFNKGTFESNSKYQLKILICTYKSK